MVEIGELVRRDVVAVGVGHTLDEAARLMTDHNVGAAIVMFDDGGPGIISERDILRAIAKGVDVRTATVAEHMTSTPVTATSTWDVATAARTMVRGGFRHLVVLDDGCEVGILSIRDLVASLVPNGD